MQQLTDAIHVYREHGDDRGIRRLICPIERLLSHLPKQKDGASAAVSMASLARPGIVKFTQELGGIADFSREFESGGGAVAELIVDTDTLINMTTGEVAKPKSVLMAPGTYPQSWSK